MNGFLQTLRNLGPLRLGAIAGVGILLLGFLLYLATSMSNGDMALLYSDLELNDSGEVVSQLESMNVPFEVTQDGATIHVPADQVDRIRLAMAQEGLPRGGSLGYEIFDESDGFGTTNFIQNINRLRALEGELARTIATIEQVRRARVHLVLPERELFSRDEQEPSASVFLQLTGGSLEASRITAIRHMVASAVPRLEPDAISVVDDHGNLLARGPGSNPEDMMMATVEQLRREQEERLARQLEALLSRSVGRGRVLARVSVEMDFDRVESNAEIFDPESQVARSTTFVEEESSSSDGQGSDPVTVGGNLPEAEDLGAVGEAGSASETSRVEETTNFEISRRVETRVREAGSINRLSVAVMVDGIYSQGPDGQVEYVPRGEAEMAQLAALVRSAVGFDASRGDTVEVVNMRFVSEDETLPGQGGPDTVMLGLTNDDILHLFEIVVLAVVALLVVLLVVRPLVTRAMDGGGEQQAGADDLDSLLTDQSGLQRALAGPSMSGTASLPAIDGQDGQDSNVAAELDALIDIDQVEGRVRASSLKKVGEIVTKHPEEAVSILRSWMYQDA
ncbi:MAG: flagellar M-ring protein FliF [Alphaproteobacteria bacterium]|nr:flagellar M-ring protein FliF [Alphaproteobacteria bacterium]